MSDVVKEMMVESAKEASKELAKQVPINDLLQPFAKGIGNTFGTLAECVDALTIPLKRFSLRKKYDWEAEKYVMEQQFEKFKQLYNKEDLKLELPEPYVAVPAIEAMSYTIDNDEIRELFANLLISSMIAETKPFVHPAFSEIIKQLTPDEAKILKMIPIKQDFRPGEPIVDICYKKDNQEGNFTFFSNLGVIGFESECEYPKNISTYINNLCRLGVIEIPSYGLADTWRYKKITDSEFFAEVVSQLENYSIRNKMFRLTDLGVAFCNICLPFRSELN